jgi:iron complex transport system ATP-binding protein
MNLQTQKRTLSALPLYPNGQINSPQISALRLENVSYHLNGKPIFECLNTDFRSGGFYVVLGPNGAGKSTLLKLLAGDVTSTSGCVYTHGALLSKYTPLKLAKYRAYLPQHSTLAFNFKVHEVVEMGLQPFAKEELPQPAKGLLYQALSQAGILHLANRGYLNLSGGERQRVHLARTLCQLAASPVPASEKIFLMDEPTASQDPQNQHIVLQIARQLSMEGVTVIAVLHCINLAANYANQVLLLKDGALLAKGKPESTLTPELLHQLYNLHYQSFTNRNGVYYQPIL